MLSFNQLGRLGRLGNQMFQYAALRGIAARHGFDFCIPPSQFTDEYKDHQLFEVFGLRNLKNKGMASKKYYPEMQSFYSDEYVRLCPDDVSLHGFFQSERYFSEIADSIREDFTFHPEILDRCRSIMGKLRDPIALHVRRTDYIRAQDKHYQLRASYYARALRQFDADRTVLIFSDEPDWCKRQPIFAHDRFRVSAARDNRIDLCLMSLCAGHIIANSSFSWWGAWLSGAGDRTVVAPDRWYVTYVPEQHLRDMRDIIPDRWTKIEVA